MLAVNHLDRHIPPRSHCSQQSENPQGGRCFMIAEEKGKHQNLSGNIKSLPNFYSIESTSRKSSCLSVCHYFEILNIGSLYHPRITPDPTYHILLGRGWCQLSSGDIDKYKDKYKVLQRPNVCYIFERQGFQRFQI